MSSSPESDDCQLYMRTAQHFELKKKNLIAKRLELEKQLLNFEPDYECDISLEENYSTKETTVLLDLDIDSDSTGAVSGNSRVLRSNKGRKRSRKSSTVNSNKGTKKSKQNVTNNMETDTQSSRKRNKNRSRNPVPEDQDIVVFDDDQDFLDLQYKPIDFEQPYNSKKCNESVIDLSQTSNLSENIDDEELENEDVTLSIELNNSKGIFHRVLKLGKYQKFERVYEELAKLEGVPTNHIVLMRDFISISPEDSPSSLNLSLYAGVKAFVTQTRVEHVSLLDNLQSSEGKETRNDERKETMSVKLQLESHKTLSLTINKDQKVVVLYKKCAEEIKCDENKIKITFDGEFVNPKDRMSDLDVEDGDLFQVHIKSPVL